MSSEDVDSEMTSEGGESSIRDVALLPSDEIVEKIIAGLEYHLSDESLTHDLFLLKHIKRQPDGYVSIKLLTGYKRVKKLTRNWKLVALAAKKSTKLELNASETRVRRTNPLPQELAVDLPTSRSLVLHEIPPEKAKIDKLAEIFTGYGSIGSIQLLKHGKSIPPELRVPLAQYLKDPESICAVIEFDDVWGASKALKGEYDEPMKVAVLSNKRRDKNSQAARSVRPYHNQLNRLLGECNLGCSETSESDFDDQFRLRTLQSREEFMTSPAFYQMSPHLRRPFYPELEQMTNRHFHRVPASPRSSFRKHKQNNNNPTNKNVTNIDPQFRYSLRRKDVANPSEFHGWNTSSLDKVRSGDYNTSSPNTPLMARRANTEGRSPSGDTTTPRTPRGPDGSRGFYTAR